MALGIRLALHPTAGKVVMALDTTVPVTYDLLSHFKMIVITPDTPAPTSTFLPKMNLLGAG